MPLTQVQGGMILPSTTLTTPIVATTMGVGGATPAASGAGITFPATQSASADANTLDDYEEGTWTPSLTFSGSAVGLTYEGRAGIYVKVGGVVYYTFGVVITNLGSSTGNLQLEGLPYASGPNKSYREDNGRVGRRKGLNTDCAMWIQSGNTYILFLESNTDTTLTKTNCSAPLSLFCTGLYFTV